MYKTKIIYKTTFYMKFMTASCSMSNFLPIVIIFRQILISQIHISVYPLSFIFKHVIYMLNMFSIILAPCNTYIYIMLFFHYLHFPEQNL